MRVFEPRFVCPQKGRGRNGLRSVNGGSDGGVKVQAALGRELVLPVHAVQWSAVVVDRTSLISLDLPWAEGSRGKAIAAFTTATGSVGWETLGAGTLGLDVEAVLDWLHCHAQPDALILLDIPIEGCEGLREAEYRRLELRLKRLQMGVLPAGKPGMRGKMIRDRIAAELPGSTVLESHPFSVLKVLWALQAKGFSPTLISGPVRAVLGRDFKKVWPPKYKRESNRERRRRNVRLVRDLVFAYECVLPLGSDCEELLEDDVHGRIAADRLDAVLGLVPGILKQRSSEWFYMATDPEGGSIAMIADLSWRETFEATVPKPAKQGSKKTSKACALGNISHCPIPNCGHVFTGGRGGWDAHASSVKKHRGWHPEVLDRECRKDLFRREYPEFFRSA